MAISFASSATLADGNMLSPCPLGDLQRPLEGRWSRGFKSFAATHLRKEACLEPEVGAGFSLRLHGHRRTLVKRPSVARGPGGNLGMRDGSAQAYCNHGRRMRDNFPGGSR